MLRRTTLARSLLIAFGGTALSTVALAQDATTPTPAGASTQLERVTVTGSNIRRTDSETPSPVQVITAEDLKKSGYTSVQDVLHSITANGQGTLSQSFSGAFASGAGGIALRGLNVEATLVLIDGHRMAPFPIGDDGYRSFVDISNIPFDAIERVEILKDGASAVYGSDAMAGVVNIILKKQLVGAQVSADLGTSYKNDGQTYHLSGSFGFGDLDTDNHNFYVTAEVRHQDEITFGDRGGIFTNQNYSGSGGYNLQPGVPNTPNGGLAASSTGYVTNATGTIVGFMPGCDATKYAAGQCSYSNSWLQIQPTTDNYNLVARYTQNLGADWQASVQASYFESKSQQITNPSASPANGYQGIAFSPTGGASLLPTLAPVTIPSTNPSYPAGTGLTSGILHYNTLNLGAVATDTDAKAMRLVGDLKGKLGAWDLRASIGTTAVILDIAELNAVNPFNLQTALNSTTAPFLVGQVNSTAVNQFVAPTQNTADSNRLSYLNLGASRELMDLAGGPLAVSGGADFVYDRQYAVAPPGVAAGYYTGTLSNNFTIGTQIVDSAYVEFVAPVLKKLEIDGAVRYDHYNLSGGHASPKLGFKYTPLPEFAVRGTASGGFKAPSPAENGTAGQTSYAATSSDPILCPNPATPNAVGSFPTQCTLQLPSAQSTNPNLKPETSRTFTLGFIVEPVRNISATIDFYSIEIDHQIIPGGPQTTVRGTNLSPIPQIQPDGSTALVVPPVAPIAYTTVGYVNANTTNTNGVEVGLEARHNFEGVGQLKSAFDVSFTNSYKLNVGGTSYQLAGTHGPWYYSGDTGNPRVRMQWANTFGNGPWSVTGTINYISPFSVTDPSASGFGFGDQSTCISALSNAGGVAAYGYSGVLASGTVPAGVSCKVASFTTFDLSGKYEVTKQFTIHGSILNLFNRAAPFDWATYGGALGAVQWNPSMHLQGAIGRYMNVGASYKF